MVTKLKKNDQESYIVWNTKLTANLVFNNLEHVINGNYTSKSLPPTCSDVAQLPQNHHLAVLLHEDDQVMAFFNEDILDDDAAIVHE